MRPRYARLVAALAIAVSSGSVATTSLVGQATTQPATFTVDDALNVVSYSQTDLSDDGKWLATVSTVRRDGLGVDYRRDGDPTYIRPTAGTVLVIETATGKARAIFPDKRNVRSLAWSPDGAKLAMLVLRGESFQPVIWDRVTGRTTTVTAPAGTYVAENSDVRWTPSGNAIVFALHTDEWKRAARETFDRYTKGPVFVQSSSDPFLAWEALRRSANRRSVVAYDLTARRTRELIPEGMISSYTLVAGDSVLVYNEDVTRKTDYDVIFGTENRMVARAQASGSTRTILPSLKGTTVVWTEDGRRFAYGKEGRVYVGTPNDSGGRQIAGPAAGAPRDTAASDTSAAARERRARERFSPVRFSPAGDLLLLSNRQGLWVADVATGNKELMIEIAPDSSATGPRMTTVGWSPDARYVYLTSASRTAWERGIARFDRQTKQLQDLVKDSRLYSNFRLSRNGAVAVLSASDGNRPADIYVADAALGSMRRVTDGNPWIRERRIGRTELLSYLDADGHRKYGVIYYPTGYTQGTRYPTVFNVYENFFDDAFDATANVLTASGYVVVKPSVDFDIGYPGEAWVKGVTSAANKLIEVGVADSAKLGVHGTSYGGYATNLLITQTNRFKAAINISGKVDIISFYTDSPRLGVRNVHAAEKSQDRLGATLWQQPQKYVAHSAIMFADRITTPLLLMTGEQDSNVPANNTREMFYALRRLGKTVEWVNYMNGGHGTPGTNVEDFTDFHRRMLGWYDKYLKGDAKKVADQN
ncbi:MAG TPA: prolyl oligopeptidase family serine peptidase [Gemmatimonadaceae bacterium]|jgi:dipeptidyl aminopeptidase/acylaminoacyl peptidase|nr:prolyl oligopeptidase family serine peptidase [Gemmatimonadaceae bacterium]